LPDRGGAELSGGAGVASLGSATPAASTSRSSLDPVARPAFKWVNTTLGSIKSAVTGTYRTIRDKHVPRYLAEFEYRFNRRYDLAAMMPASAMSQSEPRQCHTASSNWLRIMRNQEAFGTS
jgi:hypothetical protein